MQANITNMVSFYVIFVFIVFYCIYVYSTWWVNTPPYFSGNQVQMSWSRDTSSNLLASGTILTELKLLSLLQGAERTITLAAVEYILQEFLCSFTTIPHGIHRRNFLFNLYQRIPAKHPTMVTQPQIPQNQASLPRHCLAESLAQK